MRVTTKLRTEALAVQGGPPVRKQLLPYGRQSIDEEDVRAVVDVLRSDWLTTGPKVEEFEQAFAEQVGAAHAVSFSSGTAALHAAAFAAGLGQGDEAITTPLTFCATANCILYQGARPIFADICRDTLLLDPLEVQKRITTRTKALLPVDYAGHPAYLDELMAIAQTHGLVVIEDACHALGAEYKGRRVGSLAHVSLFSFHPVKHITTGEGGMLTTGDADLARRARMFRSHGIDSDARHRQQLGQWHYEMQLLGYNYRLTDVASALGISQLRKLSRNVARRRQIAARYTTHCHDLPAVIPPVVRSEVRHAWHLYPIRLDLERLTASRAEIFNALRAENIGVNVHYIPVHLHPYYRQRFGYAGGEYPVAEAAYERLLSLPIFDAMTDGDVEDVISGLSKVLHHYSK